MRAGRAAIALQVVQVIILVQIFERNARIWRIVLGRERQRHTVPPAADFTGTPTAGPAPLNVQFTDHSAPGTSPITTWTWTFGDGGTSSLANPSHTYSSPGSYSVSLTVTTADGQNTKTRTSYIQPCQTPVADFIGAPFVGIAPLPVLFTDLTTGGPTSWSWDFGDGGTSTTKNPSHTYSTPGTFTVSLTAGSACGTNTNTKMGYVTILDPCPNPIYSVVGASWSNKTDADSNGYYTRARLTWNTTVNPVGCSKLVFARVYTRPQADTTWTFFGSSSCYTAKTNTSFSMFIQGLPRSCYQLRVDVLECGATVVKASRGPADDADLNNQCFEP